VEFLAKGHSSNNGTGCIHPRSKHSPHLGRIINVFHMDLNLVAAGSADDGTGLIVTGRVVAVDSPFGDSCSSESHWVVWFLLFSKHNPPCFDAFEHTTTLPLPGDVVGAVKELDCSKRMFEGFRGHDGGRFRFVSKSCAEKIGRRKG